MANPNKNINRYSGGSAAPKIKESPNLRSTNNPTGSGTHSADIRGISNGFNPVNPQENLVIKTPGQQ